MKICLVIFTMLIFGLILQTNNNKILEFNIHMSESKLKSGIVKTKKIKKLLQNEAVHEPSNSKNIKKTVKEDIRFTKAAYDPQFLAPSSKITKVKIDKRFSKMMNDPSFNSTSTIDRYGRKINVEEANKELKQYYYMQDENAEEQVDHDQQVMSEQQSVGHENEGIKEWMENYNEESSQLSDLDANLDQEEIDDVWNDESQHVIKGQNVAVTKRLALCNYDWMNISSKDLMLLFSSFKTNTGFIKSVKVYMSNIGKEKLEEQEKYGPRGIWKDHQEEEENQKKPKEWKKSLKELLENRQEDANAFDQKKLRQYEKQRLKYFYAVIECDSKRTADQIYKQCDGNQFENSNLPFDLRFIPDDISFDPSNLKEQCNQLPVGGQVKNFITKALGHSKVSLSWQDPELSLAASLKKKNWNKLTQKQIDNIDWGMYINQDDVEKEDGVKKIMNQNKEEKEIISDWRKSCNKKYRKNDDDIEITFEGGFDTKNKKNTKTDEEVPSLKKQKKTMKERRREHEQQKKKRRQQLELLVDDSKKTDIEVNLNDQRFKAVYQNPMYTIDPVDPRFDHRRSGKLFEQIVKRNKNKNRE